MDFIETCAKLFGCKQYEIISLPRKGNRLVFFLQFQLPNVDLEQFYSRLLPETSPQTEPEQSRKPLVMSVNSATFAYKSTRRRFDEDDDDGQDYVLKSVSCDIKKVRSHFFPLKILRKK